MESPSMVITPAQCRSTMYPTEEIIKPITFPFSFRARCAITSFFLACTRIFRRDKKKLKDLSPNCTYVTALSLQPNEKKKKRSKSRHRRNSRRKKFAKLRNALANCSTSENSNSKISQKKKKTNESNKKDV